MSDDAQGSPAQENAGSGSVLDKERRKPLLLGLGATVIGALVLYGAYDFFIGSRSVSTDNAYVGGDNAQVTPLTSGRVVEVLVTDTQPVRKGQLLFRIEDADQRIALEQAEAELASAQRTYGQSLANNKALGASAVASEAQINSAKARLASAQATLTKAQADYGRRAALAGSGAVSAEDLTAARQALASAKASEGEASAALTQMQANAVSARRQEDAAVAITQGTTVTTAPQIRQAQAKVDQARLDLTRTIVRAPIDGVIARRAIQVGQKVQVGSVAMTVVPVGQLYVDANFKETQLGKVRPGQKATLTSDFYGSGVKFHGKVIGFAGGTGAAFSLIPAQNATGNWIKVVQRLPVRIELDPKELQEHPLRIGLSMDAEVDLADAH